MKLQSKYKIFILENASENFVCESVSHFVKEGGGELIGVGGIVSTRRHREDTLL